MSGITTHVLDTARGKPAVDVAVTLEVRGMAGWELLSERRTDADGRVRDLLDQPLQAGVYRLTFAIAPYFKTLGVAGFFPEAAITFDVQDVSSHYHVPLLLSPFGYSTYRGS